MIFLLYKMQYAVQIKPKQTFEIDPQKTLQSGVSRTRSRDRGRRHLSSKRANDLLDACKQKLQVWYMKNKNTKLFIFCGFGGFFYD